MPTRSPDNRRAVREAVTAAGGAAPLAAALGIKYQSIQDWLARGTVPAARVLEVERLTGVSRHRLRPDVFGAQAPRAKTAA